MMSSGTIAAISSAVGAGGRMIVRVSGASAHGLAKGRCPDAMVSPGSAVVCRLAVQGISLPIWLYCFAAPHSYTGEDLVEFHLPGNPLLARLLLDDLLADGARAAEPGEFTARAYFNGRLDLAEAEGVAATITAQNEGELRAARQLLSGELARRLRPVMDLIAQTLALVEVGIDFSEEDVSFLSIPEITERLQQADGMLAEILKQSARFERLSHEPRIVLVGRPNAGKSTLLNALAGRERAVVSPIAGTTRDVLSADVPLERGMVRVVDVAGLENDDIPATDPIAKQMREHALREIETADWIVLVRDVFCSLSPVFRGEGWGEGRGDQAANWRISSSGPSPQPSPLSTGERGQEATLALSPQSSILSPSARVPDLVVFSKLDLAPNASVPAHAIAISARTGENLPALRHRLDELAFGSPTAPPTLALNARHVQAIDEARQALASAATQAAGGAEMLALDLREALDAMGRVLGRLSPDDLLGRIFSTFCIGK